MVPVQGKMLTWDSNKLGTHGVAYVADVGGHFRWVWVRVGMSPEEAGEFLAGCAACPAMGLVLGGLPGVYHVR